MTPRPRGRRFGYAAAAACCAFAAVLLFPSPVQVASTGTPPSPSTSLVPSGDPLSAQAQASLDRVLGAGHSVVAVHAVYDNPAQQSSVQFNPGNVAPLVQASASIGSSGPAGAYSSSSAVTDNAVGRTTTTLSVPGGHVQRLSVAVIIDSSLRPQPAVAVVRAWVAAAVGLQPGRGDRITVVSLAMTPTARGVPAPRALPPAALQYLPSGLAFLGSLLLLGRLATGRARHTPDRERSR